MIRYASSDEHAALTELYHRWGYDGAVSPGDVAYVAEDDDGAVIGIVRRTVEHGVTMLRGMWLDPAHRRHGIGSQLLDALVADVRGEDCWCVPFAHLTGFYGRAGFRVMAEDATPAFLIERLARYRGEGRDVLVMCRPADGGA